MKIENARLAALNKMPYLASAIYSLRILETTKFTQGLAAVTSNGWLILNPEVFGKLGDEEAGTVLLHEAMHLISDHMNRAEEAGILDPLKWNYAADLEINDDLLAAGCKLPTTPDGKVNLLLANQFKLPFGLLAEEYYKLIELKPQDRDSNRSCGSGSGNPSDCEDEVPQDGTSLKPEDIERIKKDVANACKDHEKNRGYIPGNLRRFAENLLKEKPIDWRQELAKHVRKNIAISSGLTNPVFTKISRRQHMSPDIVLPSYVSYKPKVGVLIDTSGSMSEEELGSGLFQIKKLLQVINAEIWVCIVDAVIHSLGKVRRVKEIEAKLTGGGGTVFTEAIPKLDEIDCSCIIGISDLEAYYPKEHPKTPYIWVTHNTNGHAPFGKIILVNKD